MEMNEIINNVKTELKSGDEANLQRKLLLGQNMNLNLQH